MPGFRLPSGVRLSDGDLELLELLWSHGELTLAQGHEAIGRTVGYTTVQTRLDRLVGKGLAAKSSDRPAKYRALLSRDQAAAARLAPLVDHVHSGQVVPLVANLIEHSRLTADEVAELRKLLEVAERRARPAAKRKR